MTNMGKNEKNVVIQKEIDEAMEREVENLIKESEKNQLLELIISGDIDNLSVDEIKNRLLEENDA